MADFGKGETSTVAAGRLAPGDVIELYTGDVVPADARLLESDDLEVDESSLTGESLPTSKQVDATPQASVADRHCMVFEGTTVVAGYGRAVVVGTGDETEAGRAAHLASHARQAPGVQARLHQLTGQMLPFTLLGGAAVTGLSLLRGRPVRQAVRGGLAVAVAAVPEGLPLVATVAQLAATRRLGRIGILVRTPRALEALGRMDTACFDKTGTLTENRLHVVRVSTAEGAEHPADAAEAAPLLHAAALTCHTADQEAGVHAHSTDEAILAAGPPGSPWTPVEVQPFEASRGYASAVGADAHGARRLIVKGAPEVVLPGCTGGADDSPAQSLAGDGLRVLAVAGRRLADADDPAEALGGPLKRLELDGFVALADTPRPSSAPLVADLREAGVRPIMLTGDHPRTARAVAVQLGWPDDVAVVTGDDLAAQGRTGRAGLLRNCDVVARVAPEQKLHVVEALQTAGRVVAMVGDGANDAAAIRAAAIGVGIAVHGSAAARNAADLVITTDDLSLLVDAVAEGRALWRSVADAISVLIGGNAGEIGFSVLGTVLSGSSPLCTRQILLVNLFTDMFPAMAVSVTPPPRRDQRGDVRRRVRPGRYRPRGPRGPRRRADPPDQTPRRHHHARRDHRLVDRHAHPGLGTPDQHDGAVRRGRCPADPDPHRTAPQPAGAGDRPRLRRRPGRTDRDAAGQPVLRRHTPRPRGLGRGRRRHDGRRAGTTADARAGRARAATEARRGAAEAGRGMTDQSELPPTARGGPAGRRPASAAPVPYRHGGRVRRSPSRRCRPAVVRRCRSSQRTASFQPWIACLAPRKADWRGMPR
ncbi:hypothetical protein GCM10010339_05850 [Streptomyces alanosinicus]|uniref:P-type ATPase A domain-containing protein n=1 Tax=Streptomyces alanosinicus TaxID=68171 RepID=A0A919D0C5_9ACTN|nr:hypothetical protein GCM10010339_05850 [Streptomyces alanosinicus]